MYFSNNSRCVLRKARFLSPNYLNNLGRSLSVKKPKDDPTKPPLRINIPDDDREDLLLKSMAGTIEMKAGTPIVTFQEDVYQRPDDVLRDTMMGETGKESSSQTPDFYPYKTRTDSDRTGFDYVNNYNNNYGKKSEKGDEESQKSWFILLDVDPKTKEVEVLNEKSFGKEKSTRQFSRLQQHCLQENFKKPEARKTENVGHKSKHNTKLLSKSDKKRGRFEVHEVEDEATYILYVRLNRQLQKKANEVGYVPEKDFTIRTKSPNELSSMNENDFEFKKHSEFERKRGKSRKNEIIMAAFKDSNSFEEKQNAKREKEISLNEFGGVESERNYYVPIAEAQKIAQSLREKSEEYKIASESVQSALGQFGSADYESSNPQVPLDESSTSQEYLWSEEYGKTNEDLSELSQNVFTSSEQSQTSDEVTLKPEDSSSDNQNDVYFFQPVTPGDMSSKVDTSSTFIDSDISMQSLPLKDVTPDTESQIDSPPTKNTDSSNPNTKKETLKNKISKKPLPDVIQDHRVESLSDVKSKETQTYYDIYNQTPVPPTPEKQEIVTQKPEKRNKEYLDVHDAKNKSSKTPKNVKHPHNIWDASSQSKPPMECSSDVRDFQTSSSSVTISRTETITGSMTFGAAFPPLLKEALSTQLRLKNNFAEKWKSLSQDRNSMTESNMRNYSENSILFPTSESDKLDCESLFMTKEQIIMNIIKNDEESNMKSSEITTGNTDSSMDSLSMMKKVKEIVKLDLDNVVKIFDGGSNGKDISSVVLLTPDGWKVNLEELETQMELRKSEMKFELMNLNNNILGNENVIPLTKYLPTKKESLLDIQLPDKQTNSAITFNPKNNEFSICKEALAEAISKKTNEPLSEITETLNLLAKDLKNGDSILVFDDVTQSWKVDFSILEKRKQQLQLEEELAKTSELILETFEKLEKNQINTVTPPNTKEKKTFDYVKKEWKDIKNPNKKSSESKYPFKEADAEEIRKKNSDMYEDLFVAKKNETKMKAPEKNAPGVDTSKSKKESKSVDSGDKKEAPADKSDHSDSDNSSNREMFKRDDTNYWGEFLDLNILPKDISEIPTMPVIPPKPEKPKPEVSPLKIPIPFLRPTPPSKKETEGESDQKKAPPTTTPTPEKPEKSKKPQVNAPPPPNQVSIEDPKKSEIPIQVDVPKPNTSKQTPKPESSKWDILKFPRRSPKQKPETPKVDTSKTDAIKQPQKEDPPKTAAPKQYPEDVTSPKVDPPFTDVSKQPPKVDPPKTDGPKQPPKGDPPKPDAPKQGPKLDSPTSPAKFDPPKEPPKSAPPSIVSKPKGQDSPFGGKMAFAPTEHYVSDKIIEISKSKGKDPPKGKTKIETVKLNITSDTRLPSKITEINLNKKFEKDGNQKGNNTKEDKVKKTVEESPKEKTPFFKKFEKYRTNLNDPEYEEKTMKIKSDLVSNPNLKKLDNWNKTLVLHDIMKPPENIETWLKDETDKMATLLLKILQDASDVKPKKKQLPTKPKTGEKTNPYENIRKKQETTPESFLFRVRTVNLSLEDENKKLAEDTKPAKTKKDNEIAQESTKGAKPQNIVESLKKSSVSAATIPPIVKAYHLPANTEEQRLKSLQWGGESVGDFAPLEKELPQPSKLIIEVSEDIPGPEILKKISNLWKFLPVLDSQITVFTLLRVFQLVNLGRSFLNPQNSTKYRRTAFSKLFSKYGPIVNVRGPLSGNVILIHKPEHFAAVFEQDAPVFVRSVFDSMEQVRRDVDDKLSCDVPIDWSSSEWNELKKLTADTLMRGCEKYMAHAELSVNSLLGVMRKNRNSQDLVSEDFMEEIKRWTVEGLCSSLFEKSFGLMDGKITNLNWIMEPEKLYVAVEKATQSLSKCEGGFQLWRLMPTPSSICLSQAYSTMSAIFRKQIIQSGINLRKKNEFLKDGGGLFHLRDITLIESMMLHDGLSNDEINCNLIDMMLIGANVINSTVGFLLYNLAVNIRAQTRLFQEIKEALPTKSSHLDYNTLTSLKYLQACVKENFRLNMPIPLFYRMLQNDISLHNYYIPKGAFVVMDQRASNQKQHVFESPEKFLPERWLTEERWMAEYDSVASFPLCHGPKAEFARNMMKLQLYTVIAKIVRNFHLEYHYGEIHGTNSLINFPDKPLKLNFIERVS